MNLEILYTQLRRLVNEDLCHDTIVAYLTARQTIHNPLAWCKRVAWAQAHQYRPPTGELPEVATRETPLANLLAEEGITEKHQTPLRPYCFTILGKRAANNAKGAEE